MLIRLSCDKFVEKGVIRDPIYFNNGLNSIIGANDGANSIGKSTFLLVIDFIFGGSDYVEEATDVIDNVGNHTINFEFEFSGKAYFFSRSTDNSQFVNICDNDYNVVDSISKADYCKFLANSYGFDSQNLLFRQVMSPFIRVWGRDTYDQSKPLKATKNSPDKQGIESLLMLFSKYDNIMEQKEILKEAENKKKAFNSAQKYEYIATVSTESAYKENEKRIIKLNEALRELSDESTKGLEDLSSMQMGQLADLRRQLSNARRQRIKLQAQKKNFEAERDPSHQQFEKDFESLQHFFPETNIRKLSEIEQFHKQLASVLKKEFNETSKNLQSMVDLISTNISDLELKISEISDIPNVSQAILDKYAEVSKEISLLQNSNNNYLTKKDLQATYNDLKNAYNALIQEIFATLQQEIDMRMRQINDNINLSKKTAPYLTIDTANHYDFYTPKDRGTGSEYKGLVVFDLAMLKETPLPILVHDSILLKQIQDKSLEGIIRFYSNQKKQVFIALDKEESFTTATQSMLTTSTVLRLYPGGGELFGRAWNEESEEN
ncbi:DUF2326 domain-containing protein [Lactococcus insecticola]|uniref:DUF2326 domain-containing protein n=1 Tax=Pseudolactococcus insecticola TaxID=2709158 RepID=A0A6A0B5G7_9LACT|nr:DUF2326 domain-containing protein [Lactococcus insecticola]GFH40266.1 hypothetical protein Hs20B_06640 [Lactococcus insecticola]